MISTFNCLTSKVNLLAEHKKDFMSPLLEIVVSFGKDLAAVVAVFIACTSFMLADLVIKTISQDSSMIYSSQNPSESIELVNICNSKLRAQTRYYYLISLLCSVVIGLSYYAIN